MAQQRGNLVPRTGRAHGVAVQINGLELHRPRDLKKDLCYTAFLRAFQFGRMLCILPLSTGNFSVRARQNIQIP
jgi:hypothetical protein